jgi:hypothetical protein
VRISVASLVTIVAVACGGQSVLHEGSGEGGGQGGSQNFGGGVAGTMSFGGASGTGVAGGTAGTLVTGGFSGTPPTGGAFGAAPTGGVGATSIAGVGGSAGLADACTFPIDSGPCDAAIRRFGFDQDTGLCLPFLYGGCEGNANNFTTPVECYKRCDDVPFGPGGCMQSSDCTVISMRCCGPCDSARFDNVVAVNRRNAGVIAATNCGPIDCDGCPADPSMAWFSARCIDNQCVAFDAREQPITECERMDNCSLRYGLGCCEPCAGSYESLVALSSESLSYTCPDGLLPCPPCPGPRVYPDGAYAVCDAGRCAVTDGI